MLICILLCVDMNVAIAHDPKKNYDPKCCVEIAPKATWHRENKKLWRQPESLKYISNLYYAKMRASNRPLADMNVEQFRAYALNSNGPKATKNRNIHGQNNYFVIKLI